MGWKYPPSFRFDLVRVDMNAQCSQEGWRYSCVNVRGRERGVVTFEAYHSTSLVEFHSVRDYSHV